MTMPAQQIKHVDKEYDEEINGPAKAIPQNWTFGIKLLLKVQKL